MIHAFIRVLILKKRAKLPFADFNCDKFLTLSNVEVKKCVNVFSGISLKMYFS